jgi:hypothetical protein
MRDAHEWLQPNGILSTIPSIIDERKLVKPDDSGLRIPALIGDADLAYQQAVSAGASPITRVTELF